MIVASRFALSTFAPAGAAIPPVRTTLLFAGNLLALGWWFGALSLVTSAFARRRSVAFGVPGLAAIALYLLHLYAEISTRAAAMRPLIPFHYFNAPAILRASDATWTRDVAILSVTAAIMVIAAYRVYEERDL
jgi:ABC-type transport system involved in multi-copper enzyme maturation permease subunit